MRLTILSLLLASSGVAYAMAPKPPAPPKKPVPACGGPSWQKMRAAVDGYCASGAESSEALRCALLLHEMDVCARDLSVYDDQEGGWHANVRDPRNVSYAWGLRFHRKGRAMRLVSINYFYDECDGP